MTAASSGPGDDGAVLDLAFLDRQTMGDAALRAELLALAAVQFEGLAPHMEGADARERCALAHRVKGAARAIGAFALARAAEAVEDDPGSAAAVARLGARADELQMALAQARGAGG